MLDPALKAKLDRDRARASNYNPGVTRYDLSNPAYVRAAGIQVKAMQEALIARLEGRTAEALTGGKGAKGLYLTRDQVASLTPTFSGNALVDKYTAVADSNRLASTALVPGEPNPEEGAINAADQGRESTNAVLIGAGLLALVLVL